jgi:TolA-binding protein
LDHSHFPGDALTGRRTLTTLIALALLGAQAFAQQAKPMVAAEISRVADTAHLEFRGLKTWRYDVQKSGDKKIVLSIPPLDTPSIAKLQSFNDPLLQSVKVEKNGPDGNYQITFTLAQGDVETFDYLTDDPSRLIVDFYRKAEPEAKKQQTAQEKSKTPSKKAPSAKTAKASGKPGEYVEQPKPGRNPAGDEFLAVETPKDEKGDVELKFGIYDGGDENYDRFRIKDYEIRDEAIISSRHNIYLAFPALKMNASLLGRLLEEQPEYVIHPKDTKENREARLLQTLFDRKRFAVYLKTYKYFAEKYPDSEYMEILKNLTAHVHLERWREGGSPAEFDSARALYNELVQKFPDSPLREHNHLILGFALMERGDALSTLQTLQGFIREYPKSPEIPHVRKAVAEALMILRKYDEAGGEYAQIIKDYPKTDHAKEARYRMGDVAFAKGDHSGAIRQYEEAIKEFPAQEKLFPNANFNMAEARFWQKDFKKSLNNYVQFVNLFPRHQHGGYALTRIGELLGILGADQRRVMGAFLESYFRFPDHPGAKVARIRMLSQQMKSMKPKELKKSLEEIEESGKSLNIPGINEFTTLMVSEGLTGRGEYNEALEKLISYYQKNPTSVNLDSFKSRILRNIANELKDDVENGRFMDALTFYSQYSGNWLKNSDRIDVPFFVAGAYENAGAYGEAEKIYGRALGQRAALVGTPAEIERRVQEHLPSVQSLNLRLASTLAQDRKYIEAFQHLKEIGPNAELSPKETVERVQLSALIAEQRNDHQRAREALQELAQKWQGDPALVAPVNLQLAQTFLKIGDPVKAEQHADKVLEAEGGETALAEKTVADAMNVKGQALFEQKKALAAVESYQKLLERFEGKMPLANVRYKVGEILFDRGDLQGASEVWGKLQGTQGEFLWKIGREKLEDAKWQDDYTKYTNRIPAMAGSAKKEKKQ